ncbi:hypothetical protein AB4039_19175 [Streptomyces sp. M-16]|uniref:hypothetical protein n=1 Tax=Streptomyces sp. M-16 TaxID=3233040 RepID=UPI003F9C7D2D
MVQRDRAGTDRWAVTDGAVAGLRTWTASEAGTDWQYVSDVGRQAAFRHTLGEALSLAKTVAGVEAERYPGQGGAGPAEPGSVNRLLRGVAGGLDRRPHHASAEGGATG